MSLSRLLELNALARAEAKRYPLKREAYSRIEGDRGRHFTGIAGPRGAGKTVLLRQLAASHDRAFYVSLDTIEEEDDLFETARALVDQFGIKLLLLDEVHFLLQYDKVLKRIYDYLDLKVVFTSSVAVSVVDSTYDLSRRVHLLKLYPFTFREYLAFTGHAPPPPLALTEVLSRRWSIEHLQHASLFDEYLRGGLLPFALEEPDPLPILGNTLQKIIRRDIPLVASLKVEELNAIEKVVRFIGRSAVDGINYSSISRNIGITKYKAEQYVSLLEKAFVLNPVFPAGTNVLKEPKILMYVPFRLLFKDFADAVGALREDFVAEMMRMKDMQLQYLKSTRGAKTPDFLVTLEERDIILEVGGKRKGREQFKGISGRFEKFVLSHSPTPAPNRIPLCLLGLL